MHAQRHATNANLAGDLQYSHWRLPPFSLPLSATIRGQAIGLLRCEAHLLALSWVKAYVLNWVCRLSSRLQVVVLSGSGLRFPLPFSDRLSILLFLLHGENFRHTCVSPVCVSQLG